MRLRDHAPRILGCLLFMMLFGATAASAQMLGDDGSAVYSMTGISDGCGDTMNPDDCMASGDSSATICTMDACPACGFDQTMTSSVCYKLFGQSGFCSCQGGGIAWEKYGNKLPNCKASGSCAGHR